jgi:hypothetical protein
LGYVVRRRELLLLAADTGAAVPQHERTDPAEHTVDGISIAVEGSTDKAVEVVPGCALQLTLTTKKGAGTFESIRQWLDIVDCMVSVWSQRRLQVT